MSSLIVKEQIKRADGSIKYRNYIKKEGLGTGGFAQCYLVERADDKKQFALKVISKMNLGKSNARQKMLSQIKLHRTAKHRNICCLERAFEDDQNVYMLLELCRNKNMFDLMRRRKRLTIPEVQFYIYQLIDSLCYLHKHQIIHRDIKLGNLLLNDTLQLKLADFGLAAKIQFQGDRKHTICGTPNYIAPEIIRPVLKKGHSGHSYEVDVWSTGVILYIMLVGKAPFQTDKVEKTYERITKGDFSFPKSFTDESAKDLLKRILVVDTSKRFTFDQILAHPFMNPKEGIPKQLPQTAMVSAPKFGIFEKYAQEEVKQSARQASIQTLRSTIDVSLEEDFSKEFQSDMKESEQASSRSRSKEKEMRGLLRSVLSTSSLNKSLRKLTDLNRITSPQIASFKTVESTSTTFGDKSQNKMASSSVSIKLDSMEQASDFHSEMKNSDIKSRGRCSSFSTATNPPNFRHSNLHLPTDRARNNQQPVYKIVTTPEINNTLQTTTQNSFGTFQQQKQRPQKGPTFILDYEKDVIWSYLLSNGNICTYETGNQYKLIYKPSLKSFYEVFNEGAPRKVENYDISFNENIKNRLKFIELFRDRSSQVAHSGQNGEKGLERVIYLRRVFEVKPENLILFKFSNEDIQAHNYAMDISLIVTKEQLHLIEIKNGREVSRFVQRKDKYAECKNKMLISMYLKVKKILFKIHNAGKS